MPTLLTEVITTAAAHGWGPRDLTQVLGTKSQWVIYSAASTAVKEADPKQPWINLTAPEKQHEPTTQEERKWITEIMYLPRLRDTGAVRPRVDENTPQGRKAAKIAALLAKAESTTYEEEAATYIAAAQKLRVTWHLEDMEGSESGKVAVRRFYIDNPHGLAKATLLVAIAQHNRAQVVRLHKSGIFSVFGHVDDLDHIEDLFNSLLRQCEHYLENSKELQEARRNKQTGAFKRSFIMAYAQRISELLAEVTCEVSAEGNLPVLADTADRVSQEVAKYYPQTSKTRLTTRNAAGADAGSRYAEKSHLRGDSAGVGGQRALTA